MSQHLYDQDEFFQYYIKLERQIKGLAGAPEWPQLKAMLPDLNGLSVLDLGCGFGWFSRFARENGAASVRAIDLSEKMLDKARSMTNDDKIEYERVDLEELKLTENQYDVVFSSLTFHYLANFPALTNEINKGLKSSGRLVFSIEHPIFTAPSKPGFVVDEETGRKFWPLDDYQTEGLRITNWLAPGVKKQHRTVGSYINILLNSGFRLTDFVEWRPSKDELIRYPSRESEVVRPTFLLMAATKD
ncbi:methyltransferase type 11 [Hypoxylon trugodes]|uniref:methyltransferase type 11 n=1 Tax=Hypoxylon trugodes TaxID=326681 RepID=UPI0021981D50|nr:methyltransferase type 11 [Hypoxylon trugodes]KAI1386814.1 methyltransferase type 11 [Hypoxylon trugodes]